MSSSDTFDACHFVDRKEVAAAVGTRVEAGERHDDGHVNSGEYAVAGTYSATCMWRLSRPDAETGNGNPGGPSYVILNVMQWPAGSHRAKRFLDSFHDAAQRGEITRTPVPLNIGDGALWWGDGVAAYKGDRSFGVSVHLAGDRERERVVEEKLARLIASRL